MSDPQARRLEMVKLRVQGWSEQTVAQLLRSTRVTVRKWVRRFHHEQEAGVHDQALLLDHSHAPHITRRKVQLGTISAVLILQKKYGYAGWFRIRGYLERDFGIRLGQTALKRVMRLNRRVHLAPRRPVEVRIRDRARGRPQAAAPSSTLTSTSATSTPSPKASNSTRPSCSKVTREPSSPDP